MLSTHCLLLYYKPNILTLSTLCVTFNQCWRTCTHYALNLFSYRRCIALIVTCVCCFTICLLYMYKLVLYKQVIRLQFKYQIVQVHNVSIILLVFNSFVYILFLWHHSLFMVSFVYMRGRMLPISKINQSINQSEQSLSFKQIHTQYKVMSQQCYLKPFTHVVK